MRVTRRTTQQSHVYERYISPWALPREQIIGWVRFDENPVGAVLKLDSDVRLKILFNAHERVFENIKEEGTFRIKREELLVPGFLGFEAFYNSTPETDLKVSFKIALEFEGGKESAELQTKIIRPSVVFDTQSSYNLDITPANPEANPVYLLAKNLGEAEAIEPESFIVAQSVKKLSIKVRNTKIDVANLSEGPLFSKARKLVGLEITAQGKGYGVIRCGIHYRDRAGNTYEAKFAEVLLNLETPGAVEIPVYPKLLGQPTPVTVETRD